ncbi:MAG: YbjN domain-containing protein [Clostridium sp.]|jgi:hypothetical protein|nr:YbjN domain-containing protein [Clostridium sp.]
MSYNIALAKEIDLYLDSQEWHYTFDPEKGIFDFAMNIGGKLNRVFIKILVGEKHFSVYAVAPMHADESDAKSFALVNEYLTRANYGLRTGNFELDYYDGEMRYKASLFCADKIPTEEIIAHVVDIPFLMWARYGNGMLNVLYGGKNPAEEIEKAESRDSDD